MSFSFKAGCRFYYYLFDNLKFFLKKNKSLFFKRLYVFWKVFNLLFVLFQVFYVFILKKKNIYSFFFFYLFKFNKINKKYFDYFNCYFLGIDTFLKYKIFLLSSLKLPKIIITNKTNNILISVLNFRQKLVKVISIGQLREKKENKSVLRDRYLIMHRMGLKVGGFVLDYFSYKKTKNKYYKKLKIVNSLNKLVYRYIIFGRDLDWYNIIYFNKFYKFLYYIFNIFTINFYNYISYSLNLFYLFFKYSYFFRHVSFKYTFYLKLIYYFVFYNFFKVSYYFCYFSFLCTRFFHYYLKNKKKKKKWLFYYYNFRFDLVLNSLDKNINAILEGIFSFHLKFRTIKNVFKMQHAGCRLQKMRRYRFNSAKLKYLNERLYRLI